MGKYLAFNKIRTLVCGLLLGHSVLASGCSSLALSSEQSVQSAATSAISGRGSVRVQVHNGVATVEGWVDDAISQQAVLRAVRAHKSVHEVNSHLERQM